eukprot:257764_1
MLALTIICVIITSSLLVRSQSTLFSDLSFQHITNEDFNGVNMDIGWVEFASCKEGCKYSSAHAMCDTDDHSLKYPNGWTQQQMIDIARYAITVKILPSSDIPGSESETTEYAVKSDICSNPIYALNNGYELSFTLDLTTSFVTGFTDLNNWIGSNNAKSRLGNSCNHGSKARLIIDDDLFYQACGNFGGLHILFEGVGDINCLWEYEKIVGHDIKIWIGFDKNKAKICEVISSQEYALVATADPTAVPTTDSTSPTDEPSSFPSNEPSRMPAKIPTFNPSQMPSDVPSFNPNIITTAEPSDTPADNPSILIVANIDPKDTQVTNSMTEIATDTVYIYSSHDGDEFIEPMKPNNDELYLYLGIISAAIVICGVSVAVLIAYMQCKYKKESEISQIVAHQQPQQPQNKYANDSDSDNDNDDLWKQHETQKDTQTAGVTIGANLTKREANAMDHETRYVHNEEGNTEGVNGEQHTNG